MTPDAPMILVIDDEPDITILLTIMLAQLSPTTQVIKATTATAGLNLLIKHPISLVIVDYNLPDMNGSQLILTIQTHSPAIPIVLCTASSLQMIDLEGLQIAGILIKPFLYSQLQQIIGPLIP